jgi:DNA transposition AAA+ family ATPase
MPGDSSPVNGTIAPLRNVVLMVELVERVQGRRAGMPGMATMHGPSGMGKTVAATYAAIKLRAYHIQIKSVWTRKKLCTAILGEMGIKPVGTIPDMVDLIGEQLSKSRRPLLIDEADHLVDRGMIEIVRDFYETSLGAIILIGEEQLPHKLKQFERVHGRMLDWVPAVPASLRDAKHLAEIYCAGVELEPDLLAAIHEASAGSVRRICVNLDRVREKAETLGKKKLGATDYGTNFFTGSPPLRRAA